MDVELVLTFFDFHLSVIFITLGSNYDTSVDLNSIKTDVLMLSSPFHVHAILPYSPQSSVKNRRKCIWCAFSAALPQTQVR